MVGTICPGPWYSTEYGQFIVAQAAMKHQPSFDGPRIETGFLHSGQVLTSRSGIVFSLGFKLGAAVPGASNHNTGRLLSNNLHNSITFSATPSQVGHFKLGGLLALHAVLVYAVLHCVLPFYSNIRPAA